MDIRIVALIVLVGVVGSFGEAHSAYVRMRRNGLEESVMEFDGLSRTRRESVDSSTVESTATAKSTASARTASPTITTKKPDPTTESSSNSDPTTSSTPRSSSTAPKSSPTTDPATTKSAETIATTSAPKKPTDPGKSKSTTAAPAIGSRIDPSKDEPPQSDKKPDSKSPGKQMPSKANPTYPMYPTYPYQVPFVASSYEPPYVSPYGDSTFNSIPGPDGYGWTASSSGGSGMASSFASSGAFGAPSYAKPSISDRGAFVDNTPQSANVPNYINPGGFGYFGGDAPFFDPGFAFPTYDFNGFQQQMQDNWRRLQDQIQRQQQQIFDTANRINTESAPGTSSSSSSNQHSAVSSIQLGPGGGYQAAALNPGAPGVESRFAEQLPPPSGGSYGVFTSSSSNTMVGPDGKTVSHKVSTTGVNDNGKIHFRTVEV